MGEQAGGPCAARTGGSAALLLGAWTPLVGCGRKQLAHRPRLGRSRPRSSSLTPEFFPQTNEEEVRKAPRCVRGAFIFAGRKRRSSTASCGSFSRPRKQLRVLARVL